MVTSVSRRSLSRNCSATGSILHSAVIPQRKRRQAKSRSPMPSSVRNHSLARLYLRAVLPTLAAFVDGDEDAKRTIKGWQCAMRFTSSSGVSTTLAFRDGAVAVDPPRAEWALRLFFLSDRDVVRAFRRDAAPRALPWGGLHHLARLPALLGLLARMEEVLHASAVELPRSERQVLRVKLLLGTLLPAAVAELGGHEEKCRCLLAPYGDFVAQFQVPQVVEGWIARRGDCLAWGRGRAPRVPDLRIEFRDPDVALSAMDGILDQLAASVSGEMLVRGMIPLADALAQVMERVSVCLGTGRS